MKDAKDGSKPKPKELEHGARVITDGIFSRIPMHVTELWPGTDRFEASSRTATEKTSLPLDDAPATWRLPQNRFVLIGIR